MQLDIQNEIQNLKIAILPLIEGFEMDGTADHLMIAIEFNTDDNLWSAVPVYENAGDGYLNYLDFSNIERNTLVLMGIGSDILTAIQDLWNEIAKMKKDYEL